MGTTGPRSKLEPYDDDIRRMYTEEGLTDKAIAEALPIDVKEETVRQRRKRIGIETSRTKKVGRYSVGARYEEVKDELPAAWERSKKWHAAYKKEVGSAARVAKEFGVSQATAYDWLVKAEVLPPRTSFEKEGQEALRLFNEGLSVPRIAEEISSSQGCVRTWLKRGGIDLSAEHPTKRMDHEEYQAWRASIREARGRRNPTAGRYSYADQVWDSPQEVMLAQSCDRLGVEWEKVDRADAVEWVDEEGHPHLYAPDLVVAGIPVEVKGFYSQRDHTKVLAWRAQKGDLSLVDMLTIPQVEAASSAEYLVALIKVNCLYTPEVKEGELHF